MPFADGDTAEFEMAQKIHQLRRDMHKQGIAHNDMHTGNVFYDEDTGDDGVDDLNMLMIILSCHMI